MHGMYTPCTHAHLDELVKVDTARRIFFHGSLGDLNFDRHSRLLPLEGTAA